MKIKKSYYLVLLYKNYFVLCFFVECKNNNNPKNTSNIPITCFTYILSFNIIIDKIVAKIGSVNTPIDIVVALNHFNSQFNIICPNTVEIIAININEIIVS